MSQEQELSEQADSYQEFEWTIPVVNYPLDALKVHNVVFGSTLGVTLGMLASSEIVFGLGQTTVDAFGLSVFAVISLLLYAYGLDPPGPVDPADGKLSIATKQIKRKPHYFGAPLASSYAMMLVAMGVI